MAALEGAKTLIRNGLAQNDLDMNHFKLLNLDTSNLPPSGIPPTVVAPPSNWLNSWDSGALQWGYSQPTFTDLFGSLSAAQQLAIHSLGIITVGEWRGTPLTADFVPVMNGLRPPTGNVSLNLKRITNLGDPIDPGDAVNKRFMDFLIQGLVPHQAVKCATTQPITLHGLQTIDGVAVQAGDRVLVKTQGPNPAYNEQDPANGVYIASTGNWTRAGDMDSAADEVNRAYVIALNGTVNGSTGWVQVNTIVNPWPGNPQNIKFVLFSLSADILAGAGLVLDGHTLNVGAGTGIQVNADSVQIDPAYAGQTSISTVGTIASGIWNGQPIDGEFGGTGVNNSGHTITLSQANFSVQKVGIAVPEVGLVLQCEGGASVVKMPQVGTLSTLAGAENLTNKRITKRVATTPSAATPLIDVDATDAFYITALATNITQMLIGGAGERAQELEIWITDNGVSRFISWGPDWTSSLDMLLPDTTTPNESIYTRFSWNPEILKWVLVSKLDHIT